MKNINHFRAFRALVYRFLWPRNLQCIICGHSLYKFLPFRGGWDHAPSLMRVLQVVGSDLDRFQCPWCGCHDRERHLFLYMTVSGLMSNLAGLSVLHFAPERRLSPKIMAVKPKRYVQCDLLPQSPDVMQVDMLNMPFDNSSFNLVIANHVLEHVSDDQRALAEVARVLRPDGYAILQTPYSEKLKHSWSDAGIDTDEARLQAYGQEDHARLYGRDIFERFESFGLKARVRQHHEILLQFDGAKFGVNEAEPFFLFQK